MVGIVEDYFQKFPISSRIKINENYGTIKYVGEVDNYKGLWLGIDWDDSNRGKHNGTVQDKRYFDTEFPTSGSFIRPGKIENFESVELAAKDRYFPKELPILDEKLIRETQNFLHATVFEIVGMEKIARKQGKIEDLNEITVECSMVRSAGDLSAFNSLSILNLSSTLIWNWRIVAEIVQQIPTLKEIDLGCNRLVLPTENDISELEPIFQQIYRINLRKCGFKYWNEISTTARLWPNIKSLGLQENDIRNIELINCNEIFKDLRELDLHLTKLSDCNEIIKLGNITTLTCLLLMENGIEKIEFPDCDPNKKLSIFQNLETLNLFQNPLSDEKTFNELDKLPSLSNLCKSPSQKVGFEDMFSNAAAFISNLKILNKMVITKEERRGAEYDIWKKYGLEWQKSEKNAIAREEFCKQYRCYSKIVKKYGSPAEFSFGSVVKVSNLVEISIKNKLTGDIWAKKVPRKISLQTLQGLIIKKFKMENTMPTLSYIDANHPELIVSLDNLSKNLDFYSIQDGDTVIVEW